MTEQMLTLHAPTWDNGVSSPLIQFRKNFFSQSGEDGVIERIVQVVPEITKSFVEFGAWDGLHLSNCARLARDFGWAGIFIEGDAGKFARLQENYKDYPAVVAVNQWVSLDAGSTLDEIVSSRTEDVGLLSIDIDGNDYHIWKSFTRFKPACVVVEINPSVPNDVKFIQKYSLDVNQGASLLAMNELATEKGYELICCTSANAFFIDRKYFPRFNLLSNDINKLYAPKCNGRIFHGFDGTIFVVGMDRIIWKGISVSSDDFQVFPPSERRL